MTPTMNRRKFLTAVATIGLTSRGVALSTPTCLAGVATIDITPERSLWMAGFARRTLPSQGVAMPLHAKALALKCQGQPTAVLVTVDLLGLTARITGRVASLVQRRYRIRRADLLFNASHTHCGPVVDEQLSVAYDLSPEQWAAIRTYTAQLEDKLAAVIGDCRLADMDDGRHGATERDEIVSAVMAPRAGSGDFLAADQNQARAVEHQRRPCNHHLAWISAADALVALR